MWSYGTRKKEENTVKHSRHRGQPLLRFPRLTCAIGRPLCNVSWTNAVLLSCLHTPFSKISEYAVALLTP
jgi:hypothetical protein